MVFNMNVIDKLCILMQFFELGNHLFVSEKKSTKKIFMESDGQLYIENKRNKVQKYNPTFSELIQLVNSIDDTVYNKMVNKVNNGGDIIVK